MNYKIETLENFENISSIFLQRPIVNLTFLPENLYEIHDSSKFIYSESTTDIRKVFNEKKIPFDYLTDEKPILRSRKSADWFGPTIFIGFSVLTQNFTLINISLNLISNYLYDFFKGSLSNKKVKFEIVIESKKNKDYKKITYEGTVEGINELNQIIKELKK